jgi:hypothetical protein
MNCEEAQTQLLEYLDRTLDTITRKHLDLHLTSCPPCRAEADSLADCIQQVAALPIVDPPLGFAQRVMAHAREIERKPSIWQRLAIPSRHSTPIQAMAVVLIAVFSAYLYQKESPLPLEPLQATTNSAQVIAPPDQRDGAQRKTENDNTAPVVADRVVTQSRQEIQAKAAVTESSARVSSNITPPATSNAESDNVGLLPNQAPKRVPIQVQEVATGRERARLSRESFGLGDFTFSAPRQTGLRPASPADGPLFTMREPMADIEFVVRRRSPAREQVQSDSADIAHRSTEADVATQSTPARRTASSLAGAMIETRWFTVAPEHLELFKKDLAAETLIESESVNAKQEKEIAAKSDRPLAIKVMILPATDR